MLKKVLGRGTRKLDRVEGVKHELRAKSTWFTPDSGYRGILGDHKNNKYIIQKYKINSSILQIITKMSRKSYIPRKIYF